ncbi:protein ENHANCED DISEASE RESISTANCE 4-like [Phragmites australis]|uniref:protein ENHANCED DISEASE RESISTANCE 4-like n=1 Tax=Phragmites australis TaxID=29695 RepID=UPI002D769E9D|nr:protein ENHANCED DISEASE RESISTANCE 4-like [Phragmites australis]XP_062190084.1 protein ENHANCED DISEASE RESISTANCE 4-like [Phragmites australis]XP_062190085.1 protein ENHANCED DISEASE RESISTANCE 4-like [Phragmites australis]
MANSDARGVRHVRCPRCYSVLQEPSAPVYQCGGCGASLRAKICADDTHDGVNDPSSSGGLTPRSRHLGSSDVASTSRSSTPTPDARSSRHQAIDTASRRETGGLVSAMSHGSGDVASTGSSADATSSRRQGADTTSRSETGDLVSARKHGSGDVASTSSTPDASSSRLQGTGTTSRRESGDHVSAAKRVSEHVPAIEKKEHDQSANRGVCNHSEARRRRDSGDAECRTSSPGVSVHFPRGSKDATSELQDDTEKRGKGQAELPDPARKKDSGESAAQPRSSDREELAPKSAQAASAQSARDVLGREDGAAAAGGKAPSPSLHELQAENLAPLRKKILKIVDELKGDLTELLSKSPEANPTSHARPRLSKQEGYASRAAMASSLPARARHAAAAVDHRGSAARAVKPGQVAVAPPRGLPSRRYRRCRSDPCCDNVQPRSCHHGCCRHHDKPECGSCRGHCCRPRAQEPPALRKPAAAEVTKRRSPPRNHCRPVLKGAPFLLCSSCFKLVQVPADFAVSSKSVRKLRCGSCSAVLSYSYRDPGRKKPQESIDHFSTDGSEVHGGKGYAPRDPFAFLDDFGHGVSYSTEDEQPLHVSRNTSFDTVDGVTGARCNKMHRLIGHGSATELLRHSPDLYESFDERTTPEAGQDDRKGKGVCLDTDDVAGDDDSDEEDSDALKRSAARGSGWPLPRMPGKGVPGLGAVRIKS